MSYFPERGKKGRSDILVTVGLKANPWISFIPTVPENQRLIYQELYRLSGELALIKARRNALTPVSRLPADVLKRIFEFAVGSCQFKPESGTVRLMYHVNDLWFKRLCLVTRVCRRWRAIVLDGSDVWGISSGVVDVKSARRLLDERIWSVQRDILTLETFRAPLPPAARLPFEILSKIFIAVVIPEQRHILVNRDPPTTGRAKPFIREWFAIMHVCRKWRAAALDCSALWRRVWFTNVQLTESMLLRSRGRPLIVTINSRMHLDFASASLITNHTARIGAFRLHLNGYGGPRLWVLEAMTGPAPELQTFFLVNTSPVILDLPAPLYQLYASKLRHIHLNGFHFDPNLPLLNNCLTHLSFGGTFSVIGLLAALRGMPALECLRVRCTTEQPSPGNLPAKFPLVPLPKLSQLHLEHWPPVCRTIVHFLAFPTSASISIYMYESLEDGEARLWRETLFKHFSKETEAGPFRTIHLHISARQGFDLRFKLVASRDRDHEPSRHAPDPVPSFTFAVRDQSLIPGPPNPADMCVQIASSIPAQDVRVLCFPDQEPSQDAFTSIIRMFCNATVLHLGSSMPAAFQVLDDGCRTLSRLGQNLTARSLLPHLRTVIVRSNINSNTRDALRVVREDRTAHGRGFQILFLKGPHPRPSLFPRVDGPSALFNGSLCPCQDPNCPAGAKLQSISDHVEPRDRAPPCRIGNAMVGRDWEDMYEKEIWEERITEVIDDYPEEV